MEAIRQTVRPKHQVLILKCYPRLPKNSSAAEIKPNGSELSYLLYYASSRRSKLTKVGAFLEKKTLNDLYKSRTAAVQITLQILGAFVNDPAIGGAGPSGFGLLAPYILRILREVLQNAQEAVLVEQAVSTWDAFCRHQDHVALNAVRDFRELFAEVVSLWAGYATKEQVQDKTVQRRGKMRVGVTDNVKLRMAGLQALKSTADSETLGTEAGRQLGTVLPVVLQNLYDGNGDLDQTMELNAELDTQEKDKTSRSAKSGRPRPGQMMQRPSIMTMNEGPNDDEEGDARAAGVTADEADKLADQEANLLALRCLKSVFTCENRALTRMGTNCVLGFIIAHRPNPIKPDEKVQTEDDEDYWAVQLFKAICAWTPVQDRFVAIFAAVEMLVRSSAVEDDLFRQLLLTRIISKLLASDINFIGLSVMDVLLGLLQHILKILRTGGTSGSETLGDGIPANDSVHASSLLDELPQNSKIPVIETVAARKVPVRIQILRQLQQCVSNLAVHVYYTDQISDMINTILMRLRPGANSTLQVPHQASIASGGLLSINGDDATSQGHSEAGVTSNSSPRGTSAHHLAARFFFDTPTARETGLLAIAHILMTANRTAEVGKNYVSTHRNPVPISAWEGTTWLLKDPDVTVRYAFARAFRTWLRFEMPKLGLETALDEGKLDKQRKRKSLNSDLARRAASTASAKKAAGKRSQTATLQGIHLVVMDTLKEETDKAQEECARPPQAFDLNTALNILSPTTEDFSNLGPEALEEKWTPVRAIHLELSALDTELNQVSQHLSLLDLEDFRALQVPAVPVHPSSSRNGSSSNGIAEEDETGSASNGNNNSSRQNSLNTGSDGVVATAGRRASDRSPAPGQVGAGAAGRFDRHDFANGSAEQVRVEELKRILDGEAPGALAASAAVAAAAGSRSVSVGSHSQRKRSGGDAPVGWTLAVEKRNGSSSSTTAGPTGTNNVGAARRATNSVSRESKQRKGTGGGGATPSSVVDDDESDSLVEFEGSWGTSFADPSRERREKRVELSRLLEGISVDTSEGGWGLGRAPM